MMKRSSASAPSIPLFLPGEVCVSSRGRQTGSRPRLTRKTDITDLKRSEEIQLRYAAIVESSHDAIISENLDGVISAWNAAAQRMFGYTEKEAIGQPITIIIPRELHDEEQDILSRLRAGERIENYETVRVTKGGKRVDVSLTISPLRDAAGRIVGCSKIARDITEPKKAQAALRESEQRLAREVAGAKTLQSISARLISESTPESLYTQILDAAIELMAADAASVQILAANPVSLRLLAWRNFHPDSVVFWQRVTVGSGSTCSKALADNERVLVADIEACDFMAGTQDQQEYRRSGLRAVQSTPLRSRTGRLLGMLSTHWRTPHTPTEDDFRLLDVLARQAADLMERTLAENAVRESEERFRLAMNVAPGIYTVDRNESITYINPAAETMFGWTSAELIGRKMHDVTHYKHPDGTPFPANDCPALQVLQTEGELREYEDTFIRKDGSFFPVVFSASPLKRDGETIGIVVGFRDDTERREAERALRESEERFRLIANTAPVMIWMSDVEKQITYLNQTWLDYTGRSLDAALGHRWIEVLHPAEVERCRDVYVKAFDEREPFQVEHRLRRHDGEYRWIVTAGVPRYNEAGSFVGYIGTAIDVTERKLAEEALSTVNQKLIEAHEEESTRIARELHDDTNQRLALLNMRLGSLKQSLPASAAEFKEEINAASQQISDLVNSIQALSHRLHPSRLELLGLEAAAAGLCEELPDRHDVEIDFRSENIPAALPREISLCIYRVLQEALQNVVKHSVSRHAHVSLKGGVNDIDLTVQDSGVGFDPHEATRGRGLGLTSMRERLKLVGGQLSIHSGLGRGTMIHARVPLNRL
jgi:PAS domain S-box-containing protein